LRLKKMVRVSDASECAGTRTRQPRAWSHLSWRNIEPGSVIHTDGWAGDGGVPAKGFDHQVTVLKGKKESASELMPRVHRVASLLKRWLLGTHQGAVRREQLDYYLDEFTFRFNRRRSKSRGKLFYRLVQQAVEVDPVPYKAMVKCFAAAGEGNHNL
jgi:carotenoid cleavage dioxygenase-like enzyme